MSKNTLFNKQTLISCKGRLLSLSRPVVMGILNVTPDSFYTQGRRSSLQQVVEHAGQMLEQGATLLDVGGMSTRPGAAEVSPAEETDRVTPVIEALAAAFPEAFISVDTFRAAVAETAVQAGAHIVNDISFGDMDPMMMTTVARLGAAYIGMHMQGTPQTMQQNPVYHHIITDIADYFAQKIATFTEAGVKDIILDPGFGFGKTIAHNYALLDGMDQFAMLGKPVLAGLSRKSMIYRTLDITADEALNGTTVLNTIALQRGASILRVHDVKEAMQAIRLTEVLQNR
jgi:dihydropteroate synthase